MKLKRREFISGCTTSIVAALISARHVAAENRSDGASDRALGMLYGSLIGDALGGPIEFLPHERVATIMPAARSWADDRQLTGDDLEQLAASLSMLSYAELRPDPAPYGPWIRQAAAGTITDDSRHKIVLIRAIRSMLSAHQQYLTQEELARAYIAFSPHENRPADREMAELVEEGLREYRLASRWVLGERDLNTALPLERLWSGVANCSGQMTMPPLAAVFPGQPERAYLETFRLDFIDAPIARDIAAALNAGLAAVLDPACDGMSTDQRWSLLMETIRKTDPYRYSQVPFAGRQLDRWLDLSDSIVRRSQGRPKVAYQLLESEGKPVYYWDAHFTLLVPLTLLSLCEFRPLAAMHLTLDFGHDTDSYAQVLGAMAGAVHGMDIWSKPMVDAVQSRLKADFGESVDQWQGLLASAAAGWQEPDA
jgi:ADP-ribosylglycohydrolase